jgi:hypothetical protein
VLNHIHGTRLDQYLDHQQFSYDRRIYLCYELLKVIYRYDTFSDNIKYQLIALPQWRVVDDVLMLREIIHLGEEGHYAPKHLYAQIGLLMEKILVSQNDVHIQFMDNLILGNVSYPSLEALIRHFKDIFIYEKPEAIEAVPFEYHLTFSVADANEMGNANVTASAADTAEAQTNTDVPVKDNPKAELEDITGDFPVEEALADTVGDPPEKDDPEINQEGFTYDLSAEAVLADTASDPPEKDDPEINQEGLTYDLPVEAVLADTAGDPPVEAVLADALGDLPAEDDPKIDPENSSVGDPVMEDVLSSTETGPAKKDRLTDADAFTDTEDDTTAIHNLPPSDMPDFCELSPSEDPFDQSAEPLLSESPQIPHSKLKARFQWQTILFPIAITLVFIAVVAFGVKSLLFKPDIFEASYRIETLSDDRVAFINTSACSKPIESCEWSVYYHDQLIQSFITDNLYPIFDTAGEYTISLRIMDADGNWSDAYSEVYPYGQSQ